MASHRYRIVIQGEIGKPPAGPLEHMTVELVEGNSVLTGDLVDQAQLQGGLSVLTNLGYDLVSVNPVDEETPDATSSAPSRAAGSYRAH
jgi:hypothetical protein